MSLGILKWIHAQVSKEAFCSTPNFLSYAPVFLSLCGQTADEHPPQRPEAFEVKEVHLILYQFEFLCLFVVTVVSIAVETSMGLCVEILVV